MKFSCALSDRNVFDFLPKQRDLECSINIFVSYWCRLPFKHFRPWLDQFYSTDWSPFEPADARHSFCWSTAHDSSHCFNMNSSNSSPLNLSTFGKLFIWGMSQMGSNARIFNSNFLSIFTMLLKYF